MRRVAAAVGLLASACGARTGLPASGDAAAPAPVATHQPTAIPPSTAQARADKIDLLFVIDDSGSMSDKQAILSRAVPDLVERLLDPLCVEPGTLRPAATQPKSALEECPSGTLREFNPVQNVHVGVISTSLGAVGATSCGVGIAGSSEADRAHLRADGVPSAKSRGFLSWAPVETGHLPTAAETKAFQDAVRGLVSLGESGCPFEMPLESMYRFLVDPEPYDRVVVQPCPGAPGGRCAVPQGVDQELLGERARFLRYDSLVAVVLLTDENDCSIAPGGQSYHLFDPPGPGESGLLRCFDQKGRLGVDYLHPVDRYVRGLTGKQVPRADGSFVPNPLFVGPNGEERDPSLVFLAGVVGVPWQDLAEDPSDAVALQFKTPEAMQADGTWRLVVGDPARGTPPADPLMVESIEPRSGTQPVLHVPLAPVSATDPLANPINGHEFLPGSPPMDLQYACIFDLPAPVTGSIDCSLFSGTDRAPCQAPDGTYGSTQFRAKAYPGRRELETLQGVGKNAIVASICARNVKDEGRDDYGYRPVLRSILDRLRVGLD